MKLHVCIHCHTLRPKSRCIQGYPQNTLRVTMHTAACTVVHNMYISTYYIYVEGTINRTYIYIQLDCACP